MEEEPLLVFALERAAPPLRVLQSALRAAGHPVELSIGIAGPASDADLDSTTWEAVFLRWTEPELHDVALIERDLRGEDNEVEALIAAALRDVVNSADVVGQMIVTDHLRKTRAVYAIQLLPALLAEEDHTAWSALEVLLQSLAQPTQGLILGLGEGFFDADGELLLSESDEDPEEEPDLA